MRILSNWDTEKKITRVDKFILRYKHANTINDWVLYAVEDLVWNLKNTPFSSYINDDDFHVDAVWRTKF